MCAGACAGARAAVWTGGNGSSNWQDPFNWDPLGVPGPGDDVVIDMSTMVVVPGAVTPVVVRSLTLGDGAGNFAPTLLLSTGISASGAGAVSTLYSSATLIFGTSCQAVFTGLVLTAGSSVAHAGTVGAGPPPLSTGALVNLRVTQTLEVQAGATITALGAGYRGSYGPASGQSSDNGGGGGGHGGTGGSGALGGGGGGTCDQARAPGDYGSGGGTGDITQTGGAGGGLILIDAGTLVVQGLITADGVDGSGAGGGGGGGGAGGSVRIRAGGLQGRGVISARGGEGGAGSNAGGGGGGGGRIAIALTGSFSILDSSVSLRAQGGLGGDASSPGASGSPGSAQVNPVHWTAGAGTSNASTAANWFGGPPLAGDTVVFGSSATAQDCDWNLSAAVVIGSFSVVPAYRGTVSLGGDLVVSGSWDMAAGTFSVTGPWHLGLGGSVSQSGGRFDFQNGTVTFLGGAPQTASFTGDSRFNHFYASAPAGGGVFDLTSDADIDGNLLLAQGLTLNLHQDRTLRLAGDWPAQGTVAAEPAHLVIADGGGAQTWEARPEALGRVRVANTGPGLSVSSAVAGAWRLSGGELRVDAGARLACPGLRLELGGDWTNYGSVDLSGGTVAFVSGAADQAVTAGANFPKLEVDKPGRTLFI
ncbi:MAG: hypothetical protein PHF00_09570, partial [Elusimicrobia bacterium]|nr:hypothetical protein [Elusimicrobiota bacterium]